MLITRTMLLPLAGLPVLLLAACQAGTDVAPTAAASSRTDAPAAYGAVIETPAVASPLSERDLRERREFAEAIEGLTFREGSVEVAPVSAPDPARAAEHAAHGAREYELNHRTAAIKAYVLAVRNAPDDAPLYARLGDAFVAKGKTDMAIAAFRTAARLDEGLIEARVGYANTLAMEARTAEAIEAMEAVLALDPDNAIARERLAVWEYYEGNYAAAWEHVGHARRAGHPIPPQLIPLLERQMPDPAAGSHGGVDRARGGSR